MGIFTLPDEQWPIEHSLSTSLLGAYRTAADFMLLAKAVGFIGSCGSTFSQSAQEYSTRDIDSYLETGTHEAKDCASSAEQLDYSDFKWSGFTHASYQSSCGCYGDTDTRGGACNHACERPNPPSLCPKRH